MHYFAFIVASSPLLWVSSFAYIKVALRLILLITFGDAMHLEIYAFPL